VIADLSNADAAAKIDGWVKEVTNGAILEILGGPINKSSFVALNALHFKSRWRTPFDLRLTAPFPFTGIDGNNAGVAMMRLGLRLHRSGRSAMEDTASLSLICRLPRSDSPSWS
jgi:serine protease inhibitor